MKISQQGVDFIKSFESCSLKSYLCPAGYKTIGYGHLLNESEMHLDVIRREEALELLESDIKISENSVRRLTGVELTQNQFDMLVSFTFNLGGGAYQRSALRSKVNREDHELVPFEFMKWIYAAGKVLPGLVRRRRAEAEMYGS